MSNELGAGNIEKAKNAVSVALKLAVVLALTTVLVLLFGHDLWASFFSDSPEIIHKFAYMTPLLAFSMLFDTAQGVLSGSVLKPLFSNQLLSNFILNSLFYGSKYFELK